MSKDVDPKMYAADGLSHEQVHTGFGREHPAAYHPFSEVIGRAALASGIYAAVAISAVVVVGGDIIRAAKAMHKTNHEIDEAVRLHG